MSDTEADKFATAQISESYPPILDGVARVVIEYAKNLAPRIGQPYIIVPQVPGYHDTEEAVIRFPSLPLAGRRPYRLGVPWFSPAFLQRVNRLPIELIHCHSPFVGGMLSFNIARARRIPIVTTFHTKYLDDVPNSKLLFEWPREVVRRYLLHFYHRVDEIWAPTKASIDTIREYGYDGPVEVVDHGTDLVIPADLAAARARADDFLGIKPEDPLLLYVGQLTLQKNLPFLLQTVKLAQEAGAKFRLALVGGGYARPDLERQVQETGLRGVTFTGQVRERDLLASIYARADLFTFPSLYDTCGLVVREAAIAGVPALLLRGAAAADGVVDGENGFLSEHEPAAFSTSLKALLENPELRRRVGQGAKRFFARTWGDVADEVAGRYRNLIARYARDGRRKRTA